MGDRIAAEQVCKACAERCGRFVCRESRIAEKYAEGLLWQFELMSRSRFWCGPVVGFAQRPDASRRHGNFGRGRASAVLALDDRSNRW